jgi:hypothetical protein
MYGGSEVYNSIKKTDGVSGLSCRILRSCGCRLRPKYSNQRYKETKYRYGYARDTRKIANLIIFQPRQKHDPRQVLSLKMITAIIEVTTR